MEAASRQIQTKFDVARLLLDRLVEGGVDETTAQRFQSELAAQEVRYALSTGHLFLKAASGESGRITAKDEFARVLASENFGGEVDTIVDSAESALRAVHGGKQTATGKKTSARKTATAVPVKSLSRETLRSKNSRTARLADAKAAGAPAPIPADIQKVLDAYPHAGRVVGTDDQKYSRGTKTNSTHASASVGAAIVRVDYEKCTECNTEMIIDPDHSELRCLHCSSVRELDGTAFDDAQFYSQEGQKAKSGTFNPNRHFQFWWMHILAREPEEELGNPNDPDNIYGEKSLDLIRSIVRRDQKILRLLTVNDMRTMLREIGLTNLNKDVPLLLKKLTGVGPPSPPDSLGMKIEKLFSKAIEIGERLRRADRTNRNYYPYYIAKLLDCVLSEDDENRRILYYIYLQSEDTVRKDDLEWEKICEEMDPVNDGVKYAPTDRGKFARYRPD